MISFSVTEDALVWADSVEFGPLASIFVFVTTCMLREEQDTR